MPSERHCFENKAEKFTNFIWYTQLKIWPKGKFQCLGRNVYYASATNLFFPIWVDELILFYFFWTSHDALQNEIVLKENEILWKVYFLSFFFSRHQCQNLSWSRKLAVLWIAILFSKKCGKMQVHRRGTLLI